MSREHLSERSKLYSGLNRHLVASKEYTPMVHVEYAASGFKQDFIRPIFVSLSLGSGHVEGRH